ncbi:hypothetical protein PspLS_06265 [Pyricularia sp. CBS 133598]|nr:hypothetical protein PspLS_06265 [Pyricularia sp. CBS 133598]
MALVPAEGTLGNAAWEVRWPWAAAAAGRTPTDMKKKVAKDKRLCVSVWIIARRSSRTKVLPLPRRQHFILLSPRPASENPRTFRQPFCPNACRPSHGSLCNLVGHTSVKDDFHDRRSEQGLGAAFATTVS